MPVKRVFVIGFPKSGTTTITRALRATGLKAAQWWLPGSKEYVGELMYRGYRQQGDPWFHLRRFSAITQGDVCLPNIGVNHWPNLDFEIIGRVRELYPDCLFILNYRDPAATASSIARWNNFQSRLVESDIPGLPVGKGGEVKELVDWIKGHIDAARTFFAGYDNFLEIDITSREAPKALAEKLGVNIRWWGVANENRERALPMAHDV